MFIYSSDYLKLLWLHVKGFLYFQKEIIQLYVPISIWHKDDEGSPRDLISCGMVRVVKTPWPVEHVSERSKKEIQFNTTQ